MRRGAQIAITGLLLLVLSGLSPLISGRSEAAFHLDAADICLPAADYPAPVGSDGGDSDGGRGDYDSDDGDDDSPGETVKNSDKGRGRNLSPVLRILVRWHLLHFRILF